MKNFPENLIRFFVPVFGGCIFLGFSGFVFAATIDWSCTAGTTAWATGANWVGGTAPVNDTTTDIARFNCASYTSQPNAGTRSVAGIIVGDGSTSTAALTISTTALTIGASGIDIKANTGTVALNNAVTLGAAQVWTTASGNLFTVGSTVNKSTRLLTIGGTGDTRMNGVISSSGAMIKNGTGTLTLTGANTFTGGLTIEQGTVVPNVSNATTVSGAMGPSGQTVILGSSSGGSASILANQFTVSNPITLGASAVGTLTIGNNGGTTAPTFSGAIGLNGNDLIIARTGTTGAMTVSGAITGTGNLTIDNSGTTSTMTISTGSLNNVGTVTYTGTSTGTTTISRIIGANVTGVIKDSVSSQLTLSGVNTFTSGLTIKSGTVSGTTSAQAFGNGAAITIGDSGGSNNATLNGGLASGNFAQPITIASGSSGVKAIRSSTTSVTFSGAITLNDDLTVGSNGTTSLTLSGGITGTGNVTVTSATGTTATVLFTTNPLNFSGTFTNRNTVTTGLTTISGGVGANVTAIIQDSTTASALTVSTNGVTTTSGTNKIFRNSTSSTGILTVSGGISGTGTIELDNDTSTATNGITISTANPSINNSSTVTNTGSGTSTTLISGIISTNVTKVIQNSNSSMLTLSGVNTFTTGVDINAGIVNGTVAAAFGNGGTITVGDSSGSEGAILQTGGGAITHANPITIASGSSGPKTIRCSSSGNPIFSGAITLNDDVTIASCTTRLLTLSGGITGTGDVVVNGTGTTATTTFSTNPLNFSGTFTNGNTTVTGLTTISGGIGGNVTEIIQDSTTTSALTISTNGVTTASGTDKIFRNSTSSTGIMTISGGITGTGNIELDNDTSTAANGITINGTTNPAINNSGTVTNLGSGTSTTLISGIISTNVTGVFQNSATSQLTLSGVNTFTSDVTINAGILSANATAALGAGTNTLYFDGGTLLSAGTITSPSGRAVVLTGNATINNPNTVSIAGTVSGPGGLTKQGVGTLTLTGTTSIGGDLALDTGTFTAPSGTLTLGAGLINNGGTFTHSSGTVLFTSTSTGNTLAGNSASVTFNNVTFDGAGGEWTVDTNDLRIAGDLTVTNGTLLGSTRDVVVNGNVACGSTCGTINLTGGTFEQRVSVNKNFGTSAASDTTAWTFGILKFSNSSASASRTITTSTAATGDITATIGLVIGDAADTRSTVLDAGNRLWILSGTGGSLGNTFPTIEGRTNSANTTASTSHTVNFDSTPSDGDLLIVAVGFDGLPAIIWPGGWTQLSLTTSGGATTQEIRYRVASSDAGSISLPTDLSVEMEARAWRLGAGEYTGVPEAGSVATGSSINPDPPSVTASWGSDSNYFIAFYSGDLAQTTSVYPTDYIIAQGSANSGGATGTTMGYAGRELVSASDDPSAFTKSATGPWIAQTIVIQGYPVFADVLSFNASSTMTGNASTFRYTGNGATVACDGANYYDLQLYPSSSGSGNRQVLCFGAGKTLSVSHDLFVGDGLHAGASGASNNPTINVTGNVTIANNATFISTGGNLTIGGAFTKNGSFTHNDGTVALTTGASIVNSGVFMFKNLTTSGAVTAASSGGLTVAGDFTVSSGTFTSTPNTLTVSGNFTDNGTFAHNSGTVVFDGAGTSEIDGNSTVFNDFTSVTDNKMIHFKEGEIVRFDGLLTLTGTSGNEIVLDSIDGSSQWTVNHQGTESVDYVNVNHSTCDGSSTLITTANSINGGTNVGSCWNFGFIPGIDTINGLVQSSIKSIGGLLTAFVKSRNGL